MHTGDRAREAVDRLRCADAGYVAEHPVEDADLGQRRDDGGYHLHGEEDAGRNLHVVAQLEIGREFDALRGGDISICHKYHVGNRSAGKDGASDELADEIDAAMLIRHGHDDTNGDEEHTAYCEGEQQTVPRKMDRIAVCLSAAPSANRRGMRVRQKKDTRDLE